MFGGKDGKRYLLAMWKREKRLYLFAQTTFGVVAVSELPNVFFCVMFGGKDGIIKNQNFL